MGSKRPRSRHFTHSKRKPTTSKRKSALSKKTKAKKIKTELPDLTEIFYAFSDAQALVSVACEFIIQNNNPGRAVSVLYLGVEALDSVADRLEKAEMQFDRFRRKNNLAKEGA